MKRPRIVTVVGTRPEAIKMAPVILEFCRHADRFEHVLVSTAQHREMLEQVFAAFRITPDVDLALMQPNQSLTSFAARALSQLGNVFAELAPDIVLIQGDTTTVMSASVAAFYHRIRIGHVEAGLRTFDKENPFPEEINRRIVSVAADFNFAPTDRARQNLLREGVPSKTIFVTGNTVVDALGAMPLSEQFEEPAMRAVPFKGRRILAVTAHRRENHGPPLRNICAALIKLARIFHDVEIVYPVHLNPNVQQMVRRELSHHDRIHLVPPLGYSDLLRLLRASHLVLTDSGGIQEESPSFHKPVLILRETTERPEIVEVGAGRLVGTDTDRIISEASRLLVNAAEYEHMAKVTNPFGDGFAARRIVKILGDAFASQAENSPDEDSMVQKTGLGRKFANSEQQGAAVK